MECKNLTSSQLDTLREVSNIGAGSSTTALSMLFGTKIDMSVPNMNIIESGELFNNYKENEVVAVLIKVLDDIPGSVLYILEEDVALNMISKMTYKDEKTFTEMSISVIGEIGSIISSSFMNAITNFTGLKATASVPAITNDMLNTILISTFVETGQHEEYVLDIETLFMGKGDSKIEGCFYFVPAPGSLEKILESLGVR